MFTLHAVIKGFRCAETARIFTRQRSRRLPAGIQQRAFEKLNQIDAATPLDDLRLPPSNRLEALKGDRAGHWSIRVNDQWRACFRWLGADADDVEIVHYH